MKSTRKSLYFVDQISNKCQEGYGLFHQADDDHFCYFFHPQKNEVVELMEWENNRLRNTQQKK